MVLVTSTSSGVRFIDDVSSESAGVQEAVSRMIAEMKAERAEEDAQLAEAKARAVAAVEEAIAHQDDPGSRLAG